MQGGCCWGYAKAAACRAMQRRGLLEESDVVLCGEGVCGGCQRTSFRPSLGPSHVRRLRWGERCHCLFGDHVSGEAILRTCILSAWAVIVSTCVGERFFFFFITVFCCDKCGEQGSSVKMFWKLLFLCVCVWYERRIILYCRKAGESLQRPHFWYRACEM